MPHPLMPHPLMRLGLAAAAAMVLLAGSGCAHGGPAPQARIAGAQPACSRLDLDVVGFTLDTWFTAAAPGVSDTTHSCALAMAGSPYPYLTLTLTPTQADALVFAAVVVPTGATPLTGLGRAAYQLLSTAAPAAEVGWLSTRGELLVLRFACTPGTASAQVSELGVRLAQLARHIEALQSEALQSEAV
jgi:hypothetical protein